MATSRTRADKDENSTMVVTAVMTTALVDRIDTFAQGMRVAHPGVRFSRADAMRHLVLLALEGRES